MIGRIIIMAAALVMRPVAAEARGEVVVAGDDREEFLLGQEDRRQQELVPDAERDDQPDGEKPGPGERHDDPGEDLPLAGAVDAGRVLEIARQLQHVGAQQEDRERRVDRDVDDRQPEEVVDQAQPLPGEKERHQEELDRQARADQQVERHRVPTRAGRAWPGCRRPCRRGQSTPTTVPTTRMPLLRVVVAEIADVPGVRDSSPRRRFAAGPAGCGRSPPVS